MSGGTMEPLGRSGVDPQALSAAGLTVIAGTVVLTILVITLRYRQYLFSRKATEEERLTTALKSDNLEQLGTYLRVTLGSLKSNAYADSPEIRDRVERYIRRLSDYLAAPEGLNSSEAQGEDSAGEDVAADEMGGGHPEITSYPQTSEIVSKARSLIADGRDWDAFAHIRRELETALQKMGKTKGRRLPLSTVLFSDVDVQKAYRRVKSAASKAIHGDTLPDRTITSALQAADLLFSRLNDPTIYLK